MNIKINKEIVNLLPQQVDTTLVDERMIDEINQLEQQILNGNNSCFLISGYRGTGKTTLVNKVEMQTKDSNVVFVHLNISKYEDYSIVLRKIIREIYLAFSSKTKYQELKKEDSKITNKLELLYEHTFFEVHYNLNDKKEKEMNIKISNSIQFKDVILHSLPIIAFFLANINITFNITDKIMEYLDIVFLFISIVWIIIERIKIEIEFSGKKSSAEELIRESLYDDEIAEYQLIRLLKDLDSKKIKIVVVLDEIDKIDEDNEIRKLISDMKPLLLSGLANFILISGQRLYYKYIQADLIDDSIISSIFNKNIHVPLASTMVLKKIIESYVIDKDDKDSEVMRLYIDSVILSSNGVIRKFISLILQDIYWDNKECYLRINEDEIEQFKTDSKLLNIIKNTIEHNINDSEYKDGIKDFLIYQLYIWIKKMKLKGKLEFNLYDIVNVDDDYTDNYPLWCKLKLNELYQQLLESLVNQHFLEKIEREEEQYYKWTSEVEIKSQEVEDDVSARKLLVLQNIIEVEKWARYAFSMIKPNENNKKSLSVLIRELIKLKIISEEWMSEEKKKMYRVATQIKHGEIVDAAQIYDIQKTGLRVYELIEEYAYYIISRSFSKYNMYSVERNYRVNEMRERYGYDAVAISNSDELGDIIFEVKYRNHYRQVENNMVYTWVMELKQYSDYIRKNNKLVVLWFAEMNENQIKKFENKFLEIVKKELGDNYKNMLLVCICPGENDSMINPIEVGIDTMIKEKVTSNQGIDIA